MCMYLNAYYTVYLLLYYRNIEPSINNDDGDIVNNRKIEHGVGNNEEPLSG